MRTRVGVVAIALVVALCAHGVLAQETTGSIIGSVASQDGAALPGVAVSVANEDTGFSRTSITDGAGEFKFVALQPATYQLQATLTGFQTYRKPVTVNLGRTAKVDFVMALGAVNDVIEVTGEAPLVDVRTTTSGMVVNADRFNEQVPVGRESTQIALMAPTSVEADTSFNVDADYTPGQSVASIGGASAGENLYEVNGLNITNHRNMVGSSFIPLEFIEEVQVKTGGYEAEFGRSMGGVINMVTKSGTNSFHGGFSAYWRPESLQEQEPDAWDRQNQSEFAKSLELNASIGGPIVRDHLFFFAFARYDDTNYSQIRGERETVYTNNAPYYGGKVDWGITPNHRVEGTYIVDETDFEGDRYAWDVDDRRRIGYIGTGVNSRGGSNYILKYTGIFAENFLASAQYGYNEFDRSDGSNADQFPYAWDCRVSCTPIGGWVNTFILEGLDTRDAYRVDLDWYLGQHSLRGGIDAETLESSENSLYSGGIYYRYALNEVYDEVPLGTELVRARYRTTGGDFETKNTGMYLQDSWAVSNALTVNFGVRWEQYENFNTEGTSFIKIDDQFAPRIGFVWDPSRQGRQKIYGSFGQYHIPIASNTNIRLAGLELDEWTWYELLGGINPDGSPAGLGQALDYTLLSDGEVPDSETIVANDLEPMSQFEYILGYEQMVGANWSLGARVVHRTYDKMIEDMTLDQGLSEVYGVEEGAFHYVLANPGSDFSGFYDVDGDGINDPIQLTADELGYPEGIRQYYAVELSANRRFADKWMLQATYVWSQSYGNYEGYLKSDLGQDDAGLTQDFDFAGLMDNSYGFLPNDRRHNLKVFGSYAFDMGLQLGGYLQYRTGRPINAFAYHPTDPWAALYENSSFFYQDGTPAPRGSVGTTDDVVSLDAMIKYDFSWFGAAWNVRLDLFNVFDQSAETQVREFSGTGSNAPDLGFLETTNYQTPRQIRLGFGVAF